MKLSTNSVIGNFSDSVIGAPYQLVSVDAQELSTYLKLSLKDAGIDYSRFNSRKDDNDKGSVKNPPIEIYEYQNFFLLEKPDGSLCLLDGFRRLLWYKVPSIRIRVRIYKQVDLPNESSSMLKLLLYLNHAKFYGLGEYTERGFALFLHTVFGINVHKCGEAFESYLCSDKIRQDYSYGWGRDEAELNSEVKKRILSPMFVSDIKFLQALADKGFKMHHFLGAMVYVKRQETSKEFSAKELTSILEKNESFQELSRKLVDIRGSRYREYLNQSLEIIENAFDTALGKKTEKSYAERVNETKQIVAELKKDKGWTKLTGMRDVRLADRIMERMIKEGKGRELEMKCVIHPSSYEQKIKIEHGVFNEPIKYKFIEAKNTFSYDRIEFAFKAGEEIFRIGKKFMGNDEYATAESKKYDTRSAYKIDLFVNIPKSEIEKERKK